MARILYTATDGAGQPRQGYVDADSAAAARVELEGRGLTGIALHEEPAVARGSHDADGLGEAEQAQLARFKLALMRNPGPGTVLVEVVRRTWWLLLAAVLAIGWGLRQASWLWIACGVVAIGVVFVPTIWSLRHGNRYLDVLRRHAVGDWDGMRRACDRLRGMSRTQPMVDFDLDLRIAYVEARNGSLEKALASVESWRAKLADQPGMFDMRVAVLHLAAGDYAGYTRLMAAALEANPGDPSRTLDLALAHARFGSLDEAARLLGSIDTGLLPPHAAGFVGWARGVVALRRQDVALAVTALADAVAEFLRYSSQPAIWTALAFTTMDHALALNAAGRRDEARRALVPVWPIVRAHARAPMLRMLQDEGLMPGGAAARGA